MTPPDKCPRCGAELIPPHKGSIRAEYQCGSDYYDGVTYEGRTCTETQRDALAARVKELEEAGDAMRKAARSRTWPKDQAHAIGSATSGNPSTATAPRCRPIPRADATSA